mmetsp:Transcript_22237/g.69401  ORF Transcript_22237/g.69401 Transcript_22237/m.69401 type:complete len:327 (-) Transcript_22237:161-1141(-)
MRYSFFPNPANATETRLYSTFDFVFAVLALRIDAMAPPPQVQLVWRPEVIVLFVHAVGGVLLCTFGPNVAPHGLVSRFLALYGPGNPVVPCPGSSKLFAAALANALFIVSFLGAFFLGPKSIVCRAPLYVVLIVGLAEVFAGLCAGCWIYRKLAHILGWEAHGQLTPGLQFEHLQVLSMYKNWPKSCLGLHSNMTKLLPGTPTGEGKDDGPVGVRMSNGSDDDGSDAEANVAPVPDSIKVKWEVVCEDGVCVLKPRQNYVRQMSVLSGLAALVPQSDEEGRAAGGPASVTVAHDVDKQRGSGSLHTNGAADSAERGHRGPFGLGRW